MVPDPINNLQALPCILTSSYVGGKKEREYEVGWRGGVCKERPCEYAKSDRCCVVERQPSSGVSGFQLSSQVGVHACMPQLG
jgi:hypothetical protein